MKELSLVEIKKIQIGILQHLDDFCKKHDIRYCLCNGTLLGAAKYRGYIPWDDDIDVCLLREDYDKLLREYDKSNGRFRLFSYERCDSFLFPFAKLSDEGTILVESNVKKSDFGVNIDIFPIDSYGDTLEQVRAKCKRMQRLRYRLNFAKLRAYSSSNFLKSILKYFYSLIFRFVGAKHYCRKIISLSKQSKGRYYGDVVWGFYGTGEAFERAVFTDLCELEFEGKKYPAPRRFDEYLSGLYGDWRSDPPPEKRKTHHGFKVYLKQGGTVL